MWCILTLTVPTRCGYERHPDRFRLDCIPRKGEFALYNPSMAVSCAANLEKVEVMREIPDSAGRVCGYIVKKAGNVMAIVPRTQVWHAFICFMLNCRPECIPSSLGGLF